MWMALIDMRNCCTAMSGLIFGETLEALADSLLYETSMLWEFEASDGRSLEEIEEDHFCELDDYRRIADAEKLTPEDLRSYSCSFDDAVIEVGCVVKGYPALVRAFGEYTEDKMILDEWGLDPDLDPTPDDLTGIDEELRSLTDGPCDEDSLRYFVRKEEYEEDEEEDF